MHIISPVVLVYEQWVNVSKLGRADSKYMKGGKADS